MQPIKEEAPSELSHNRPSEGVGDEASAGGRAGIQREEASGTRDDNISEEETERSNWLPAL